MQYAIPDAAEASGYRLSSPGDTVTFKVIAGIFNGNGFNMDWTKTGSPGQRVIFGNGALWNHAYSCYVMVPQTRSDSIGFYSHLESSFRVEFSKPVENIVFGVFLLGGLVPRTLDLDVDFDLMCRSPDTDDAFLKHGATTDRPQTSPSGKWYPLVGKHHGCIKFRGSNSKITGILRQTTNSPEVYATMIVIGVDCCGIVNAGGSYEPKPNTLMAKPRQSLTTTRHLKTRDNNSDNAVSAEMFSTPINQKWQWDGQSYALKKKNTHEFQFG
jgi:hypothetical protein